jgi:hypothetical protein
MKRFVLIVLASAALASVGAGCGGSDSSSSSAGAADPQAAASGFVASVRDGDGEAACAYLTEAEQEALVTNAKDVTPALDTESCETVVASFHDANTATLDQLDGTLENVSDSGEFASATWVWAGGNGEQAVLLAKKDDAWLLAEGGNDFPTAVLHFFDQA